jgi:hypothetical protein
MTEEGLSYPTSEELPRDKIIKIFMDGIFVNTASLKDFEP